MSLETRRERRRFAKTYKRPNTSDRDFLAGAGKKQAAKKKRRKVVRASRKANR